MLSWRPCFSLLSCWNASNPRHLLPSVAWRSSMWRDRHGQLLHVGDIGVLWLWWEAWFGLENEERSRCWDEDFQAKASDHLLIQDNL